MDWGILEQINEASGTSLKGIVGQMSFQFEENGGRRSNPCDQTAALSIKANVVKIEHSCRLDPPW